MTTSMRPSNEVDEAKYGESYSDYGFQSIWKNGEEEDEEEDEENEEDEEKEKEKEEEEEDEEEAQASGAVLFAARFMCPALAVIPGVSSGATPRAQWDADRPIGRAGCLALRPAARTAANCGAHSERTPTPSRV
jgi:hypothetical protein